MKAVACLRCDERFDSEDPRLNRICPNCKGKSSDKIGITPTEKARMNAAVSNIDHRPVYGPGSWFRHKKGRAR